MADLLRPLRRASRNPNRQYEELKQRAAKARYPFDKDVLLNVSFFLDQQYVEWVADANMVRVIPRRANETNAPRPVANKIMHFVQQEHTYALQNDPTVDVLPATDDPMDVSIAQVALAYLKWLTEPQVGDFGGELSDATLWALIGGESFIKWTFSQKEGRPDFAQVSPLDLYGDPYVTQFKKSRYVIHSQYMDIEQVFETYGREVPETALSETDQAKAALLRELGQAPILKGAVVNELWLKPSRRHPDGVFTVWSGNELLVEADKFPYAHKQLPFTQIGSIPRPGTPHYTCAVKYLRAPQMELNKYHAQRLMVREAFANPKWWIPTELELESDPDDSPRQILRGNSMQGQIHPEILQPTVFPENTDGTWLVDEMQDVVGLHEISQGQVPGRVEAAQAIEQLRESDTSRLKILEDTTKRAISNGFWQCLMLAKQYVSETQIVQTYSREGLPEVKRFKTEDIKPGMKVNITLGTGLARSRAARQDQVMTLWDKQIIRDPEVMAQLLDVPVDTLEPQMSFDIRLARNENLVMVGGKDEKTGHGTAITPNSWDNHEIHLREHNNYRKTGEFEGKHDDVKKKFESHCQFHEQLWLKEIAKEAGRAAVAQAAAQAAVGQPPQGAAEGGTGATPAEEQQPQESQPAA